MSPEEDFELAAAGLRADGSDLRISAEVLASKLESSLPSQTHIERSAGGLLGRRHKTLKRLQVVLGDTSYELTLSNDRVEGHREKRVGGISIKREQLSPADWVSALTRQLREEAQGSAQARTALEGLLG